MKGTKRRISTSQIIRFVLAGIALLSESCLEENTYPSLVSDFVCMQTDGNGSPHSLITDEGATYTVELSDTYIRNNDPLPTYVADTVYRVAAMFEPDTEEGRCLLYDMTTIYSRVPVPLTGDMAPAYDPVYMQSIRKSGNYLNIIIQLLSLNGEHHLGVFDTTEEGATGMDLTLLHKNAGDAESYRQSIYMSIPLEKCHLLMGDTIRFHANVYNEGMRCWEIVY